MNYRPLTTITHEPDFTPENGKEPDHSVPVVGAGTRGFCVTFTNGAIVPLRSREVSEARHEASIVRNRMRKLGAAMTAEQKDVLRKQLYTAHQKMDRAQARAYAMYGITKIDETTFHVDPAKYPAIVEAWREASNRVAMPVAA